MQQARQLLSVHEEHAFRPSVFAEARQLSVVLEPEPAEHLDHDGRQDHEANQDSEPEEVSSAVKLSGHPNIGAPVYEKSAHSDHGEDEVGPGVL